jgi:hypothetical protein
MSRISYPRVSKRTLPRPRPPKRLPPLKIALYRHGEFVKVVTLEDPRTVYCRAMAENFGDLGMEARPITEGGAQ